jgi:branched-chain amino acid transport system permease protein
MSAFQEAVVVQVGIAVLLALGYWVAASTGRFAFGHAGFMSIGAYAASIMTVKHGWSLWAAVLVAAATATIAGAAVGLIALRLNLLYLAIITFVFAQLVATLINQWDYVGGATGFVGMSGTTIALVAVWVLAVVAYLVLHTRSRLGLACAAIREDEVAARAAGLATTKIMVQMFAVSAAITGAAGALAAHFLMFISPRDFDAGQSMVIVLYVVFGGIQYFWGAAAGAIVLSLLPIYLNWLERWYQIAYGALFVVLMILRPQGIVGRGSGGLLRRGRRARA